MIYRGGTSITYLKVGVLRAIIPFVIMTAIAISLYYGNQPHDQAKSTFIVGIIIAAVAGFSILYNVEGWSLLKQSIVHFVCMLVIIFPCLLLSDWFVLESFTDILKILGIFLICGIVLWSIFYLLFGRLFNK